MPAVTPHSYPRGSVSAVNDTRHTTRHCNNQQSASTSTQTKQHSQSQPLHKHHHPSPLPPPGTHQQPFTNNTVIDSHPQQRFRSNLSPFIVLLLCRLFDTRISWAPLHTPGGERKVKPPPSAGTPFIVFKISSPVELVFAPGGYLKFFFILLTLFLKGSRYE
jgi:hypothetical protein